MTTGLNLKGWAAAILLAIACVLAVVLISNVASSQPDPRSWRGMQFGTTGDINRTQQPQKRTRYLCPELRQSAVDLRIAYDEVIAIVAEWCPQ